MAEHELSTEQLIHFGLGHRLLGGSRLWLWRWLWRRLWHPAGRGPRVGVWLWTCWLTCCATPLGPMDPAGLTRVERRFRHQRRWRSAAGRRKHPHRHAAPPAPGGGPGRTSSGARARPRVKRETASLAVRPRGAQRARLLTKGSRHTARNRQVDLRTRVGGEGYQICSNNQVYSITKSTPSPNLLHYRILMTRHRSS